MWKRSENIVHRLFSRQISRGSPNTHLHRARGFYENVVPSHTVYEVDCPDQWWRRFTNDGQYLVCFSRSSQDLLIYRPLWLSYHSKSELNEELPASANKFESHFSLLHRIPLATGVNEVICKDFFLSTENNLYGIFATSTAPDANAPAAAGAVAGVPCIEKITFIIVRLADGVITARSVFQDDYIHLAHNAGVFLHDDLLAILSVRFQRIHILQIRDGGLFLDVRTIGEFCREDDELLLNSQAQEESQYQEQAMQRKARGMVNSDTATPAGQPPHPQTMKFWGSKPWRALMSERRHQPSSHEPRAAMVGTSQPTLSAPSQPGVELDSLYEGYFRGLLPNGSSRQHTGPHGSSLENVHVWRFEEGGNISNNVAGRHLLLGGEYSNYEEAFASHPGVRIDLNGNPSGFEALGGRGEYPAYESVSRNGSSSHSHSTSSSDTRDALGLSIATVQPYAEHRHGSSSQGHRTRPVPTMFSGGSQSRRAESSLSQDEANLPGSGPGPGILFPRPAGGEDVDSGVTGGPGRGGDSHVDGTDGRPVQDEPQPSGQILGGLKHRLLSFILQCIQNDDTSPAIKAQRLKRFYYHFQQYMDLVMWKVQFLDRCHLLIKFGSTDGLVPRNSEASNQITFLAVYNMETTDMLGFYQNSSEELLQCVERYCDHFRMAPQYPLYMNFISSYSNNSFAREFLQKQKAASLNSKIGTYSQVVKRTLASLPHNSQSQNPSPYFDQYLFHYDEKVRILNTCAVLFKYSRNFCSCDMMKMTHFTVDPCIDFLIPSGNFDYEVSEP
ncbi:hypothetical protein M758_3G089800 [Ceratodon purpureus]|nr:hypothetical protein M758_3G089800 [Ceratodon purpureus]KAG0622329.1 hypothetical protein M758_3G089800 [Ceratodon purpureus]